MRHDDRLALILEVILFYLKLCIYHKNISLFYFYVRFLFTKIEFYFMLFQTTKSFAMLNIELPNILTLMQHISTTRKSLQNRFLSHKHFHIFISSFYIFITILSNTYVLRVLCDHSTLPLSLVPCSPSCSISTRYSLGTPLCCIKRWRRVWTVSCTYVRTYEWVLISFFLLSLFHPHFLMNIYFISFFHFSVVTLTYPITHAAPLHTSTPFWSLHPLHSLLWRIPVSCAAL